MDVRPALARYYKDKGWSGWQYWYTKLSIGDKVR